MKCLLPCALVAGLISPVHAQEWVVGAGYADFSSSRSQDTATLSIEYRALGHRGPKRLDYGWAAAVSVFATGDIHIGGGVVGRLDLGRHWFAEASVMPGVYLHNRPENDLGSAFEIRSLIAIGKELKNGGAISLALTHKSNASTAAHNPGVNALLLRWHVPLDR